VRERAKRGLGHTVKPCARAFVSPGTDCTIPPHRCFSAVVGPITSLMWLPMLAFEVPLGLWLLTRGVAAPTRTQPA